MADATSKPSGEDLAIVEFISRLRTKTFLVINKADLVKKEDILPLISAYSKSHTFDEVIPISALKGDNLTVLLDTIQANLPEGPMYYPEDEMTEQPERFIAAELIREKIFHTTRQEIPYATAVMIEDMKERGEGKVYIRAVIYVERDSQKAIIIGANGENLKKIGRQARIDIERLFGVGAFLDLWVKVKKDWRTKPGSLREMGYD
jgi:GTP-binding protein Era